MSNRKERLCNKSAVVFRKLYVSDVDLDFQTNLMRSGPLRPARRVSWNRPAASPLQRGCVRFRPFLQFFLQSQAPMRRGRRRIGRKKAKCRTVRRALFVLSDLLPAQSWFLVSPPFLDEQEITSSARTTSAQVPLSALRRPDTPAHVWKELVRLIEKGAKEMHDVHHATSWAVHSLLLLHIDAYLQRLRRGRSPEECTTKNLLRLVHDQPPERGRDRLADLTAEFLPNWIRAVQREVTICSERGKKPTHNLTKDELCFLRPLLEELGVIKRASAWASAPRF